MRSKRYLALLFSVVLIIVTLVSISALPILADSSPDDKLEKAIILKLGSSKVYVNNFQRNVDSVSSSIVPIAENGRTLVPAQLLAECYGFQTNVDNSTSTVVYSNYYKTIKVIAGSNKLYVNNNEIAMDTEAKIYKNRVYVPLRKFVEEGLGKKIFYDRGVIIISDYDSILNSDKDKIIIDQIIKNFNNLKLYIPILMYHNFLKDVPKDQSDVVVTPEEFDEHLAYFTSQRYTAISFLELLDFMRGDADLPDKPFMITIDDGYENNYTNAFPILKKYNVKAAISIISAFVGTTSEKYLQKPLTWDEAKELEGSGLVDIFSHGEHHADHSKMNSIGLLTSVDKSEDKICSELGSRDLKLFTYPGGLSSESSRKIISDLGFVIQLTGQNSLVTIETDLSDIKRINVTHGMTGKNIEEKIQRVKASMNK